MEQKEINETFPSKKQKKIVAVYARIALDIANRIAKHEILEGTRLSGRSTMSSEYGVSPETIRRAFSLLEEMDVVEVKHNSGVYVLSQENAQKYITKYSKSNETKALLARIHQLINEHDQLGQELFSLSNEFFNATERFSDINPFPTYEYTVKESSIAVGKTLAMLDFWQKTKATVIAVRRQGSIHLSPGPELILQAEDILIMVGDQDILSATAYFLD
ncbi:MAG: TrkA C-terminal domain-containing protein [Sphaerochaeta sp.]